MFGLFKSYDEEYLELYEFLTQQWCMKPEYARSFLTAYKKSIGKLFVQGKQRMEAMERDPSPDVRLARYAMIGEEYGFAIVGQAYNAFKGDLPTGKHIGTPVQKAVWAILANQSDLVKIVDPQLAASIRERLGEKLPALLSEVFEFRSSSLDEEMTETGSSEPPKAPAGLQFPPAMPDFFDSEPLRSYLSDQYLLCLFGELRSIGHRATGSSVPLRYLYTMLVIERATNAPRLFVTLETGFTDSVFLCVLDISGAHRNLGDGSRYNQVDAFEAAALDTICQLLKIERKTIVGERLSGGAPSGRARSTGQDARPKAAADPRSVRPPPRKAESETNISVRCEYCGEESEQPDIPVVTCPYCRRTLIL